MSKLFHGPLNKSMYTQQLELLTKCLLRADNNIKFKFKDVKDKSVLYAIFDNNLTINVSLLMSKADFSHIYLSAEDSTKYMQIMGHSNSRQRAQNNRNPLTNAEKEAIKRYTGIHSTDVNDLLYHNKMNWFGNIFFDSPRKRILHSVMLASALNKIQPKKGRQGFRLYRGEGYLSHAEIEARKKLVEKKKVSAQLAFYSTSSSKDVASRFGRNNKLIITNALRKSIKGYSLFKSEREHIQLPGFLQWTKYKFKNGIHKFYAKIVEPVTKKYNCPSDQEIKQFEDMKVWAISKNMNIDFLTPNLRRRAKSPRLRGTHTYINGTPVATLQGAFRGPLVPEAPKKGILATILKVLQFVALFFIGICSISILVTFSLWVAVPEVIKGTLINNIIFDLCLMGSSIMVLGLKGLYNKFTAEPTPAPTPNGFKISSKHPRGKDKEQNTDKPKIREQKGIYHLRRYQQNKAIRARDQKTAQQPKTRGRSATRSGC